MKKRTSQICNDVSKLAPTNKETNGDSQVTITTNLQKNSQEIPQNSIFKKIYDNYYFTKSNAVDEMSLYNSPDLKLFSFDIPSKTNDIVKAFIVRDYHDIYKLLSRKPIKNIYENFEANDKVKLFIDLDYKFAKNQQTHPSFDDLCNAAISSVNTKLIKFNIIDPSIIILSANTTEKLSAHIIYPEIIFQSINHLKYFMNDIESDLIKNDIFDLAVYKVGSFRTFLSSKYNKDNQLVFHSGINYRKKKDYDLFLDTLITNCKNQTVVNYKIPNIIKNKPIIHYKENIVANKQKNIFNNDYVSLERIKQYLDLLNIDRGKKYDTWFEVAKTLFNCNTDSLDLFIEWSRKVPGYENTPHNNYIKTWNSLLYYIGGMENLRRLAKIDNPNKFKEIEYVIEKNNFDTVKFEKEYLLMDTDNDNDIVRTNLKNFIDSDDIKSISFMSPYNTGKTTLLKHILDTNKYERVLFVTFRKTLTADIFGSLQKYNFHSYLDKEYCHNKFICQIDSLFHLSNYYQYAISECYPTYDLVILDEIESSLNHFSASTLQNKNLCYRILKNILYNSDKIIALDGDFSNRSYDYIQMFGEHIIMHNTIKKNIKHFIFRNNKENYDKLIDADLKAKKNICIVSMSSKVAEAYYEKYNKQYKCCIHTGLTDDDKLEKLKDVNTYWKQHQLIIYSPHIEAGVNFDVSHIDKIYGVLAPMSTSQRAFMQMLGRPRQVKDNKINIFLNGLRFSETAPYFTFNETKDYMISSYDQYLTKEDVTDEKTNKVSCKYIYDDYVNLQVHNKKEELNKNSSLFVPYLLQLIKNKGHTYEYIDDEKHRKIKLDDITLEEIYNAKYVNDTDIKPYMESKQSGTASKEDKFIIEKYMFRKIWKVDYFKDDDIENKNNKDITIDKAFFVDYFRKTFVLLNMRNLMNDAKMDLFENVNNTLVLDFDKAEMKNKLDIIKKIITKLGFDLKNMDKLLDKETFQKNLSELEQDYELFKNEKVKILFGFNKNKLNTVKSYMGFLNSILKNYGICIHLVNKIIRNKEKVERKCSYKVKFDDIYFNYL